MYHRMDRTAATFKSLVAVVHFESSTRSASQLVDSCATISWRCIHDDLDPAHRSPRAAGELRSKNSSRTKETEPKIKHDAQVGRCSRSGEGRQPRARSQGRQD